MSERHNAESVAASKWWIGRSEGHRWLGPFESRDLAIEVRTYVEATTKPVTFWVFEEGRTDG